MTQLELIAEVGSGPMEVVNMYFKGLLTVKELRSILGKEQMRNVERYLTEREEQLQ